MRVFCSVVIATIAALCFPGRTPAQALFKTDPTPLERPAPLKTLKSGDTAKICDAIAKALTDNGFKVTNQDCDVGEFEATKKTRTDGEFDKVLIWLERDFEKPKDVVKLFFLYGRYETLAGHAEPVRISITVADEDRNVGALKEVLTSLKI
ncbi:MAG TPA: hypothetical protein VJO16_00200 [Candidatus Acidoferrum sp.]|nr:hypothetical protein [Candidatus Acidoferrum sp.]